jgi:membrane-associated phospholipid phosphatase
MNAAVLGGFLGIGAVTIAGTSIALQPDRCISAYERWGGRPRVANGRKRFRHQREWLVEGLGPGGAFAALILVSLPVLVAIVWLVGVPTQHEPMSSLHWHIYSWFQDERQLSAWATRPMHALTHVGNWPETFVIGGLGAIALAFLAHPRYWLPPLLIGTAIFVEWCVQMVTKDLLNASHTPTGSGTYPSGGTARVIAVYGLIAYLHLRLRTRHGWGWRSAVAVWMLIALLAFLEGYSRIYLGYHWASDVAGGVLLGVPLLAILIAASGAFNWAPAGADQAARSCRPEASPPGPPPEGASPNS